MVKRISYAKQGAETMMITITAKEGRKIIEQSDVSIKNASKWIAQDKNGEWFTYTDKPTASNLDYWGGNTGELDFILQGSQNKDWRDTLIKVSDIK